MRRFISFSSCALLVCVYGLVRPQLNAEDVPRGWYTDFNAAQAQARKLNRPILLHLYGSQCPPCVWMESSVLNTPEVVDLVTGRYVGVKVDGQKNRWLMNRYGINSFPTDLFLTPDGKVIGQSGGKMPKNSYVAMLNQFAPPVERPVQPDPQERAVVKQPERTPQETQRKTELTARAAPKPGAPPPDVAMEGFCPVTLWKTRTWKLGRREFARDYEGQTYYMAGPEQLAVFKLAPERYAPRILGCDPVLLTDNNEPVPGTTKFGAYFEGALYLFKNGETRKRFREDPEQYIRIQQVKLDPKQIQR